MKSHSGIKNFVVFFTSGTIVVFALVSASHWAVKSSKNEFISKRDSIQQEEVSIAAVERDTVSFQGKVSNDVISEKHPRSAVNSWNARMSDILYGNFEAEHILNVRRTISAWTGAESDDPCATGNCPDDSFITIGIGDFNQSAIPVEARLFVPVPVEQASEQRLNMARQLSGKIFEGHLMSDKDEEIYRLTQSSASINQLLQRFREHSLKRYPDSPSLLPIPSDYLLDQWPEKEWGMIEKRMTYTDSVAPQIQAFMTVQSTIFALGDGKVQVDTISKGTNETMGMSMLIRREMSEILIPSDKFPQMFKFVETSDITMPDGSKMYAREVIEMTR